MNSFVPLKEVSAIQYGLRSPEEILEESSGAVFARGAAESGLNREGTSYNAVFGTIAPDYNCQTCGLRNTECPGHFGHIELVIPIVNPLFLEHVFDVLQCMCFKCGDLLVDMKIREQLFLGLAAKYRLKMCVKLSKKITECPWCGTPVMKYRTDKNYKLQYKTDADTYYFLPTFTILDRFKKLTNYNIQVLGFSPVFSRPEWMILTVIPVPPPSVRPFSYNSEGEKMVDNLTTLLDKVIEANKKLAGRMQSVSKDEIFSNKVTRAEYEQLALSIAFLFKSQNTSKVTLRYYGSNKSLKSIKGLLHGRDGFIRGHCMGKRVDFAARTVISPDVNLDVDEVGIPEYVAKKITYPEYVSDHNLERLRVMIKNGKVYPGANYVFKAEGNRKIRLQGLNAEARNTIAADLARGDVVARHLVNGDYGVFNRQPSLHRLSLLGVRLRIIPNNNTFRLSICSTAPLNADFDGDECNLHIPQTETTRNEVMRLMMARNHFVSAGASNPIISLIQDNVSATYLISKYANRKMDRATFMQILSAAKYFNSHKIPPDQKEFRYIELIEALLPDDFTIDEAGVKIINGKFINIKPSEKKKESSPMPETRKRMLEQKLTQNDQIIRDETIEAIDEDISRVTINKGFIKYAFVKAMFYNYGPTVTNNFIIGMQKMTNEFLMYHSMSCSINDVLMPMDLREKMKENLKKSHAEVGKILTGIDTGEIITPATKTPEENYEMLVSSKTGKYLRENESMIKDFIFSRKHNNFADMINSKSKGTLTNVRQIADNVGQITIANKRIGRDYGHRSLPHFSKFEETLENRGFVSNSFLEGLDPIGFFFHAAGSRMGLIDTALKVSTSGYMSRKFIKLMEDNVIAHDNHNRRCDGRIISLIYGGHGFDTMYLNEHKFDVFNMDEKQIRETYIL